MELKNSSLIIDQTLTRLPVPNQSGTNRLSSGPISAAKS